MPTITEKKANGTSTILDLGDAADPVISIREWAALIGVGYSSAKKMLAQGDGPKKTRLSMNRIGVAVSSHAKWVRERTEA